MLNYSIDGNVARICREIRDYNVMGPIVFVTPEVGKWSTVGGVGVMVDELTQNLAALNLDVHVVSPYYNYNRKGILPCGVTSHSLVILQAKRTISWMMTSSGSVTSC